MKDNNGRISIYVHIPFCARKCKYCDFLSGPSDGETIDAYVDALCREITISREPDDVPDPEGKVVSIFFGGGTPSILTASQLRRIYEAIADTYVIESDAEITLECNPGTVDGEKLAAIKSIGFNRLSIGLQSANDAELKALGRIHNYDDFLNTYRNARAAGFANINVDIMSALPGQSLDTYRETVEKVLELEPEHISAYSLIVEEETPFYDIYGDGREALDGISSDLPDEETERQMYYDTLKLLQARGYERYEISNYSKPGLECRHNLVYWTGDDYIGFGIGAASYVRGVRYSNVEDINEYLAMYKNDKMLRVSTFGGSEYINCYHTVINDLRVKDRQEEFMFVGLRLMAGISRAKWYKEFHCDIQDVYGKEIDKLVREGMLETEGDSIRLTTRGIDVSNIVLANFLQ